MEAERKGQHLVPVIMESAMKFYTVKSKKSKLYRALSSVSFQNSVSVSLRDNQYISTPVLQRRFIHYDDSDEDCIGESMQKYGGNFPPVEHGTATSATLKDRALEDEAHSIGNSDQSLDNCNHGETGAVKIVTRTNAAVCVTFVNGNRTGNGKRTMENLNKQPMTERMPATPVPVDFVEELQANSRDLNAQPERRASPNSASSQVNHSICDTVDSEITDMDISPSIDGAEPIYDEPFADDAEHEEHIYDTPPTDECADATEEGRQTIRYFSDEVTTDDFEPFSETDSDFSCLDLTIFEPSENGSNSATTPTLSTPAVEKAFIYRPPRPIVANNGENRTLSLIRRSKSLQEKLKRPLLKLFTPPEPPRVDYLCGEEVQEMNTSAPPNQYSYTSASDCSDEESPVIEPPCTVVLYRESETEIKVSDEQGIFFVSYNFIFPHTYRFIITEYLNIIKSSCST